MQYFSDIHEKVERLVATLTSDKTNNSDKLANDRTWAFFVDKGYNVPIENFKTLKKLINYLDANAFQKDAELEVREPTIYHKAVSDITKKFK